MNFDKGIVAVYFQLIKTAQTYYYHDERAYDLAAEAVLRALEARSHYDESRPLLTWCRAIMRNLWVDAERSLTARNTLRLDGRELPGGEPADQLASVNEVTETIRAMRSRSKSVDTLVDFAHGWSLAEIAEARGLPMGTVKRRIHDGRRMLRKLVKVN